MFKWNEQNFSLTKNKKKFASFFLILTLTFTTLVSCGLNDEAPNDTGVYDLSNLNSSCELDTEKLSKLLEQDVSKDIDCLQSQIDQFVQFVRRDNPNVIERSDLNQFIAKFFPESKEVATEMLKLVYRLNTLLLKDPEDNISRANLKRLFQIFKLANKEGQDLYTNLEGLTKGNYWQRRIHIFQKVQILSEKLISIINDGNPYNPVLNVESFISDLKDALDLNDDQLNIKKIKNFLFLKKLIIGGEKGELSSLEFSDLLNRVSDLLILGMDVIFVGGKEFQNQGEEYFFYYDVVKELQGHFADLEDTEFIFEQDDLLTVANEFLSSDFNINNMSNGIQNFKKKFFGGAPDQYLFRDVQTLMNWGIEFTGMLYFNEITYDHFNSVMARPEAISGLNFPGLENYHVFPDSDLRKYWSNFDYIGQNYRFFSDSETRIKFFQSYKRNRKGFQLISMLRWAITKIVTVYGHYPKGRRVKEADAEDFKNVFMEYEDIIKEIDFWPEELDKFVVEAVTSADLFMFHADGNESCTAEEFTEYAVNALHSFDVANDIHEKITEYCPVVIEESKSIDVTCYRNNILKVFFKDLKLERFYGKLHDYYKQNGAEELKQYFINIELYSRVDPNPKIPLSKEDLSRIIVILTSLEAAYLRFDVNKDSILDRGELDMAYLVFKNLVITVADLGEGKSKLYKSIFLYLVKNMKVPNATQLSWFHLFGRKKDITSTRFNISAILSSFNISD